MKVKFANKVFEVLYTQKVAGLTMYAVEDEPNHIDWLVNVEVVDAEKKELKKIEQNPAWSEEDEKFFESSLWHIKNSICNGREIDVQCEITEWFKSLKNRVQPQTKREWSEGDEAAYNKALDAYYYKDCNDKDDVVFALKDLIDLIEKHRKAIPIYQRWKPSEEQIEALEHFVRSWGESGTVSPYDNNTKLIYSLLQDLKKLKG